MKVDFRGMVVLEIVKDRVGDYDALRKVLDRLTELKWNHRHNFAAFRSHCEGHGNVGLELYTQSKRTEGTATWGGSPMPIQEFLECYLEPNSH